MATSPSSVRVAVTVGGRASASPSGCVQDACTVTVSYASPTRTSTSVGHAVPVHARGAETRTVAPTWTSKGVGARSSRARASDADANGRAAGT